MERRTHRCKEIPRIELVVAQEFECAAMEFVSTAARYYINLGAGVSSVFSRKVRSLNLNFLNEVDTHVIDLTSVAS